MSHLDKYCILIGEKTCIPEDFIKKIYLLFPLEKIVILSSVKELSKYLSYLVTIVIIWDPGTDSDIRNNFLNFNVKIFNSNQTFNSIKSIIQVIT